MAKNDLIGGSLWENYSNKVYDRMNNPLFMGEITQEEADRLGGRLIVADYGAEACGDAVRLYMTIDPDTDKILKTRFKTFGCGTAIASSDVLSEMCEGKTVDEALEITNVNVEAALRDKSDKPAVPPQKMHCSVMAYDVVKKAVAIYKGVDMVELEKKDIVCECAQVSLKTIKDVIRINDLKTVEEITQYTKAGAFCKSCIKPGGHEKRKYYLVDILEQTRLEMNEEKIKTSIGEDNFSKMNIIQRHKAVEKVMEQTIRPKLAADGGGIEVVDMKINNSFTDVYVNYKGACLGCPSSKTFTLSAISESLQNELDKNIKVHIV